MWSNLAGKIIEGTVLLIFMGIASILYNLNESVKDLGSKVGVVTETVRIYHDENKYFREIISDNSKRITKLERELAFCCGK